MGGVAVGEVALHHALEDGLRDGEHLAGAGRVQVRRRDARQVRVRHRAPVPRPPARTQYTHTDTDTDTAQSRRIASHARPASQSATATRPDYCSRLASSNLLAS